MGYFRGSNENTEQRFRERIIQKDDERAKITRMGTIRMTNVETGETEFSGLYSVRDVVAALDRGESIESIVGRLA